MAHLEIETKNGPLWDIKVDGQNKTALATGMANRLFQGADMSRLKSVPGYIREGSGAIREWPIQGMAEWENQMIFWGEPIELIPLDRSVPFTADELQGWTELFILFKEQGEFPLFSEDGFFRTPAGGLFSLPLHLMDFLHARQSREELLGREAYNHPDLKEEKRLSHTLAILAFQSATGELPFTQNEDAEWIHEEMWRKDIPSLKRNDIKKEDQVQAVDRALKGDSYPSLEEWAGIFRNEPELPGTMTDGFK
ncbi:MAG: hypothetical protein PQJ60_14735, partial [Spirochaetales bacterium]|nr:hypothetical protein [Spirochaetales bacterium]